MKWLILIGIICSIHLHLLPSVESKDCKSIEDCSDYSSPPFKCASEYQNGACISGKCECRGGQKKGKVCNTTDDCHKRSCGKYIPDCENNKCMCVEPGARTCSSEKDCPICTIGRNRRCTDGECECEDAKKEGEPCDTVDDCLLCKAENTNTICDKVCKCVMHVSGECTSDDYCVNKVCSKDQNGECIYARNGKRRCLCYRKGCRKSGSCTPIGHDCLMNCCYGSSVDKTATKHENICNSISPLG